MPTFTYPSSNFDRPHQFLAALGSFWARIYGEQSQMESYAEVNVLQEAQNHLMLLEAAACVARSKVPLFHTENWYFLQLKESDLNPANAELPRYGDSGLTYNSAIQYDAPNSVNQYAFPLPSALVSAPLIMNRITSPSRTWVENVDYLIDRDRELIIFRENPLTDPLVATRPIFSEQEQTDTEAGLWVFRGQFDWQYAYDHFGYVLGIQMQSSRGYRDLLNALFDALVGGMTGRTLRLALQAMTGIPLVVEATEVVEVVEYGCNSGLIATDKNVYKFARGVLPLVAVGDTVRAGDPLTDALQIYEFNRGQVPSDLLALALDRGFLATCFYGDLIFENKDVTLTVDEEHSSGHTYVSFPIGGQPLDVIKFFDELHARGVADIRDPACPPEGDKRHGTLAMLLDTRTQPSGEPKTVHLPTTINPLGFLITNVLRNHAVLVRVKSSGMGRDRVGLYNARHLRKLIPPHTALLLVVDLTADTDTVAATSVTETTAGFTAMNPLTDLVDSSLVSERQPRVRLVSGTCQ